MSAQINLYIDSNCKQTVAINVDRNVYDYILGPISGLDSTEGDYVITELYLKNDGDARAYNVEVDVVNNDGKLVSLARPGAKYFVPDRIVLGDMAPAESTPFQIQAIVPKGQPSGLYTPYLSCLYDTDTYKVLKCTTTILPRACGILPSKVTFV